MIFTFYNSNERTISFNSLDEFIRVFPTLTDEQTCRLYRYVSNNLNNVMQKISELWDNSLPVSSDLSKRAELCTEVRDFIGHYLATCYCDIFYHLSADYQVRIHSQE